MKIDNTSIGLTKSVIEMLWRSTINIVRFWSFHSLLQHHFLVTAFAAAKCFLASEERSNKCANKVSNMNKQLTASEVKAKYKTRRSQLVIDMNQSKLTCTCKCLSLLQDSSCNCSKNSGNSQRDNSLIDLRKIQFLFSIRRTLRFHSSSQQCNCRKYE